MSAMFINVFLNILTNCKKNTIYWERKSYQRRFI